jgi:hypothetical protein
MITFVGCLSQKSPSVCVVQTCLACKPSVCEDEKKDLKNLFQLLETTDVWAHAGDWIGWTV